MHPLRPVSALVALALPVLVAGGLVLPLAGPASAAVVHATTSTDPARIGLYGSQDPSFDGAYRQSLAILGLVAAGQSPDPTAVTWLLEQQCADGGFEAFRATLSTGCSPPSSTTFSGEDSNSTGLAVQALHAVGKEAQARRGLAWLAAHQSRDGGWAYYPDGAAGNDSDANSTALGLSAYHALRQTPPRGGGNGPDPQAELVSLQVGCSGAADQRGAFTFFGSANDYATVQATLAVAGGFLPVPHRAGADDAPVMPCPAAKTSPATAQAPTRPAGHPSPRLAPARAGSFAAGYLARLLATNHGSVPDPFNPGQTDYGTTANAVIALVYTGHGSAQVTAALGVLAAHVDAFATKSGADLPGALGTLILTSVAGGQSPTSFAGSDLVARLQATLTVAAATPTPTGSHPPSVEPVTQTSASVSAVDLAHTGANPSTALAAAIGVVLVAVGTGMVATSRRRRGSH
jgi:hypothetical protein